MYGAATIPYMAVGDIGKRIRDARESLRPVLPQGNLARMLGVSQSRLSNWERGQHDPPADVIQQASRVLKKSVEFFYGEEFQQNNVYYKDTVSDSGPDPALVEIAAALSDPRTIRARASVVDLGGIWSAKGAQVDLVTIYAYLVSGGNGAIVKIKNDEAGAAFPDGTLLSFQATDYPHPDTYLLLENRSDPDLRTIRFIDSQGDPNALVSDNGQPPLRLSDWRTIGAAWAEVGGIRIVIRPDYLGPRKR